MTVLKVKTTIELSSIYFRSNHGVHTEFRFIMWDGSIFSLFSLFYIEHDSRPLSWDEYKFTYIHKSNRAKSMNVR